MSNLLERFLRYVKVETTSDENTGKTPSTPEQLNLARMLFDELKAMGIKDVTLSEHGYVYASIPSNIDKKVPTIGFIAHMDTSPDMSGKNVNPQIVKNYDGGDIVLNKELNVVLSPKQFPELSNYKGKTLITTDGTTLLGADDKAGLSEIMTAAEYIMNNPDFKHGNIKIGFTPDEEIGEGADHFDVEFFNADLAYTMDGGPEGELECENFNASGVKVTVKGRNVHPGSAKDKMINSMLIANEYLNSLPDETPSNTEGYEGFYHLTDIKGEVEKTVLSFILRDFFNDSFDDRNSKMKEIADKLNVKYGEGTVSVEIKEQYRNMKEKIEPVWHVIENAQKAMEEVGVTPNMVPIRGGTDGARLSFMGLPTPNIFTGGENYHGKYEYACLESMEKAVDVILKLIEVYTR
ncbi:peptidase T [Clostridium polynesiense]|uniref:peptidase T n=1 Tax=Clostridium polynesiense TaxID=1325933 RepID=UPI0005909506|nr:peptidase T [Clostridium polynesiense]